MSAQALIPGVWPATGDPNLCMDFPVRSFPYDIKNLRLNFTTEFTGTEYKDTILKFTCVDSDCPEKFIMEIIDHTFTAIPPTPERFEAAKKYLHHFINNQNALLVLANVTEPCNEFNLLILGYLIR